MDQVDPAYYDGDIHQLLQGRNSIDNRSREQSKLGADPGQESRGFFQLGLHLAFNAVRLDRLHGGKCFHQRRVSHGGGTKSGLG